MQGSPWWFSGAVGLAGIIGGIVLKWLADMLSERQRQSAKSVAERKELYARLGALVLRALSVDEFTSDDPSPEATNIALSLTESLTLVGLVAPPEVWVAANEAGRWVATGGKSSSRSPLTDFLNAARRDLGTPHRITPDLDLGKPEIKLPSFDD